MLQNASTIQRVLGQLPPSKLVPGPNPQNNPNPKPNPNQKIFLLGNCLVAPQP